LNPHPEQVTDELFQTREFFDPRDLVQVKYEMLRRVETEGLPVKGSAAAFGFSRPSFYQAQASLHQGGLPALMPQKRGPKQAHKLTAEVLAFIRETRQADPGLRSAALVSRIQDRYGIAVHPRSVERALARSQKKTAVNEALPQSAAATDWVARYEQLRKDVLTQAIGGSLGLILFLRQGMTAWMRTCACAPTPGPAPSRESVQPSKTVSALPGDVRFQAAVILAGILLRHPTEGTLCKATCTK
jgi:transposase